MAPSKRKSPRARGSHKAKTAQLRPRLSDTEPVQDLAHSPDEGTDHEYPSLEDQPFRLMDLAPELRIIVYEKVLENHPVVKLSRSSKNRELSSTSVLPRVSKQVRNEFLSVVIKFAPIIETPVCGFNFSHVITFLNRLSDVELEKLTSANASRTLKITLHLGDSDWDARPKLQRWLNRAEHPTKKGANIDFQYQIAEGTALLHPTMVNSVRSAKTKPSSLEAVKIQSALDAYRRDRSHPEYGRF